MIYYLSNNTCVKNVHMTDYLRKITFVEGLTCVWFYQIRDKEKIHYW
jgi:hypothetical protein